MNVSNIITSFSKDILQLVRMVMDSNVGINDKIGINTLSNSDIYKTLQVKATNDGDLMCDIILNDYLTYIENGRRKGAKMPPIESIEKWARKHGIPTDNSTIYLIRRAIANEGIKARPFMATVFEEITKRWNDDISENLFNKIIEELSKYFNN